MAFGMLDYRAGYTLFVMSIPSKDEFPAHHKGVFARHFFGKATCVKCTSAIDNLYLLELPSAFNYKRNINRHIVCSCGHPVWRLESAFFSAAEGSLTANDRLWRRKSSLAFAGGKHTKTELQRIVDLQNGCCIYCNKLFTDRLRPSKDHILPVTYGGSDWAINLFMTCRSCNCRRGNIPFRTYCKLLSPTQNKRILKHLCNRIMSIDTDSLSEKEFSSFQIGLSIHDPNHSRYLSIRQESATARHNTERNQLLPKGPALILKKTIRLLRSNLG